MDKDVTEKTRFGDNDGEYLPLYKCVCGREYKPWDNILSIYRQDADPCEGCGRKLYFKVSVTIMEVEK